MITTPKGWWRNLGRLLPRQDNEGILDDYYLSRMMKESWMITTSAGWWRNLGRLLPQQDDEGILDDYYLSRMVKESWTITTSAGWWRNLGWLLPQQNDEGILDDYYLSRMMKESWTITTPKGNDFYLLIVLSWKGKELVVCNVMMHALCNDVLKVNEIYDMMHMCMYHDVWKCDVLAGENKSRSC